MCVYEVCVVGANAHMHLLGTHVEVKGQPRVLGLIFYLVRDKFSYLLFIAEDCRQLASNLLGILLSLPPTPL